ncbi:MAG TPA: SH3 domain-containing protein, partial [Clostridia bacterium]|nr:SH3 domain-containing protein [Clostridia bacterium]
MRKPRGLLFLLTILMLALLAAACSPGDIFPVLQPSGGSQNEGDSGNGDNSGKEPEESQGQDENPGEGGAGTDNGTNGTGESSILYISASKLNIRQDASKESPAVGSAIKGAAVKVLEAKVDENNTLWYLISTDTKEDKEDGWIAAEYTVADRYELLDETLRGLDYSPQQKVDEYPGNPRVKVKGIYVTIYSAGGQRIDQLIEMANKTGIN